MIWGSVGFVYMGATMRLAFLAGLGTNNRNTDQKEGRGEKSKQT